MNVTVSVFGRFHAFNLAHELEQRGHLERLITTYPTFEVKKYGISPSKVRSLLPIEVAARAWAKFPATVQSRFDAQYAFHEVFDRLASRYVPKDTDVYVGWSGFSEHGMAHAGRALTILERGSAHIEYQRDILLEEYQLFGLQPALPHPEVVRKELREYQQADRISIPSTYVKRTFRDRGVPEDKLIQVPYGVSLQDFSPQPKHDDVFRVVCAGAMSLRKGVHYLLQAFSELQLPKTELWLIGAKNAEMGRFFVKYSGRFRHFDHVPQKELGRYYSQCSVFALCSIDEGMAMVQPQAMACGLPLICTSNTGGSDLIDDGVEGFLVPIRDVEALKDRILYLYENADVCAEMGEAARLRITNRFTWGDYGSRIVMEYERALSD